MRILDRLTDGLNKIVMSWKVDVERLWGRAAYSDALRRKLAKDAPGFTLGFDNVGLVRMTIYDSYDNLSQKCHSRHNDALEGKPGYIPLAVAIAVKNRVPNHYTLVFISSLHKLLLLHHCRDVIGEEVTPLTLLAQEKYYPDTEEITLVAKYFLYNIDSVLATHIPQFHRFSRGKLSK